MGPLFRCQQRLASSFEGSEATPKYQREVVRGHRHFEHFVALAAVASRRDEVTVRSDAQLPFYPSPLERPTQRSRLLVQDRRAVTHTKERIHRRCKLVEEIGRRMRRMEDMFHAARDDHNGKPSTPGRSESKLQSRHILAAHGCREYLARSGNLFASTPPLRVCSLKDSFRLIEIHFDCTIPKPLIYLGVKNNLEPIVA
jgi:hypothetical protein